MSPSLLETDVKKCPYCLAEVPVEAKKCKHCGEWIENPEPQNTSVQDSNPLVVETRPKPVFARTLAWVGCALNGAYLIYTIFTLLQDNPENTGRHIFVALISVTIGLMYIQGGRNLKRWVFDISIAIAILGFCISATVLAIIKAKDGPIDDAAAFVTGSIVWLILNIVAIRQVKRYHQSPNSIDFIINQTLAQFFDIKKMAFGFTILIPMVALLVLMNVALCFTVPVGIILAILIPFNIKFKSE